MKASVRLTSSARHPRLLGASLSHLIDVTRLTCVVMCVTCAVTLASSPHLQRAFAEGTPEVSFEVINIERPLSRTDKRLIAPRRVTLFASRPPLPAELGKSQGATPWERRTLEVLRPAPLNINEELIRRQEVSRVQRAIAHAERHAQAQLNALKAESARFVRERVKAHTLSPASETAPETAPETKASQKEQKVSPASAAKPQPSQQDPQQEAALQAAESQMRAINEGLKEQGEDDDELSALIALASEREPPQAPQAPQGDQADVEAGAEAQVETQASDEEAQATRPAESAPSVASTGEGQLCGQEGEPCCEQGFDDPCAAQLLCQSSHRREGGAERERWTCLPAPPPCGGYDQACCEGAELACPLEGLSCVSGRCVLPPLPRPTRSLSVGRLRVIKVRGRFLEAEVVSDRLKGGGVHAVMQGDLARP